ncbi:MAG: hypothetical protein K2Y14_03280 [Burkholderiales bacterium]|nr:hypothetical protein [Burkholderiales bacterium]
MIFEHILANEIDQTISKQIFINDVIDNFNNNSYRSCVISLWNIILLDLELKINDLYQLSHGKANQSKYQNLHDHFIEIRNEKKMGEDMKLLEEISKTTKLITPFELEGFIKQLKLERNLCAHPVDGDKLYIPNIDIIRGLIHESVKILSRKSFNYDLFLHEILDDVGHYLKYYTDFKTELKDDDSGIQLLYHKFFKNMNEVDILKFFNMLWKFVFLGNNTDEVKNRIPNFMVLNYLCKEYKVIISKDIIDNKIKYVNKIIQIKVNFNLLSVIIISNIDIFMLLKSEELDSFLSANRDIIECCLLGSIFLGNEFIWLYGNVPNNFVIFDNYYLSLILKHENSISQYIPSIRDKIINLIVKYYINSESYNTADFRFQLIQELIDKNILNKEQTIILVSKAEQNLQCCHRGKVWIDHVNVYEYSMKIFPSDEFEPFVKNHLNFFKSCSV